MDIFLIFQRPLHWLIVSLTNATLNYGLAIILFTIIIRAILSPLYFAQMRSSKKMMELSPKIKELQKKYAKDRETLTREMMLLYKEHNHNPAIGCILPIIQLPILWSLFLVLRDIANHPPLVHRSLYTAGFLWIDNLGKPDQLHILPIIAGITQWIQQRMMLQPTNDPQQRQMNQIMQFLPLMIVVFAWNYPAGLAVYWVTGNIIMIGLQLIINHDSPYGPWGQLFTSPFTIPTPNGEPAVQTARATSAAPQQMMRRQEPARARTVTAPSPAPEVVTSDAGSDAASKMERYQARHGRSAARGRPSAKGAKK